MSHRALLLPAVEPPLRALLTDVLADLGIEFVDDLAIQRPEIVLVVAAQGDISDLLARAQRHRVPIIVLAAYDDDLMVERARQSGVESVYPLGRPLAELRQLVAGYLVSAPLGQP